MCLYVHSCNLRGYEGYRYPTFRTEGCRTPTFQDKKVKNLLSPVFFNRGDLRRLIPFLAGALPGPRWENSGRAHDALPDPESNEEGYTSSLFSSPLALGPKGAHSPSELVPHFLDQSYAPVCVCVRSRQRTRATCRSRSVTRRSAHCSASCWTSARTTRQCVMNSPRTRSTKSTRSTRSASR